MGDMDGKLPQQRVAALRFAPHRNATQRLNSPRGRRRHNFLAPCGCPCCQEQRSDTGYENSGTHHSSHLHWLPLIHSFLVLKLYRITSSSLCRCLSRLLEKPTSKFSVTSLVVCSSEKWPPR